MDINALRLDLNKEKEGAWVRYEVEDFATDIWLKIARWGNPEFVKAVAEIAAQRKVVLNVKELDAEQRVDVNREAASRTILLDWKGATDNGQPLGYSPGKALEFFRDPEMRNFWAFVVGQSMRDANFRKEIHEADQGNSSTSSGGTSPGDATSSS
jgi:hypothetical protein